MNSLPPIHGEVRTFFDAMADPMWLFDRQTLKIIFANPAAGELLGCKPADLAKMTIAELRLPEDVPALLAALGKLGDGDGSGGIWRLRTRRGGIIHVDFHWKPIVHEGRGAVLASLRDVTDLVLLEKERSALLATADDERIAAETVAQQFREMFESAPGSFLVLTADEHRIFAVSNAYLEATMTRRESLLGRPIFEAFPDDPNDPDPDGEAALRDSLSRAAKEGITDVMGIRKFPIPRPVHLGGGYEERFWSIINAPIRDASERIAYVVHRVEDVTEIVRADQLAEPIDEKQRAYSIELLRRTEDLQLANALLRENEANLRTVQRLLEIGNWKLHPETGEVWWSDNVAEFCGLTPDQAPRDLAGFMELLHPDDKHEAQSELEAFLTSGEVHFEFRHRLHGSNGRILHILGVGELINTHQGRELVGVVQNVTSSVESSHELSRLSDLLQIAGAIASFGGWYVAVGSNVVELSDQAAAVHDLKPGVSLTVNEAISFYIPDHREHISSVFQACIEEGKRFDEILQMETVNGRRIWIRTVGMPVLDKTGLIVAAQGALQDISEIVRMREKTEELAHSLMRTLENISDAVITVSPDWRYTFVNNRAERLLKHSRDELLGRVIWEVFPEALGTEIQRQYEMAIATGEAVRFEAYYPAPLDTWFEVNAYPTAEGLGIYFRDVGDRHLAEAALRRSEERFRMLTRAANDMVWDWNVKTGAIWANQRTKQILGHSFDDAPGDAELWRKRVHPEDLVEVQESFSKAVESGAETWASEYRYQRADNSHVTLVDRGVFLRDASGRVTRMISSVIDVTESRSAEAQLRQALRLEAVGQLTGGLAHDFNNLLTIILGNAELLSERLDHPRLRRMAQLIAQAASRGGELTDRLLSFARQQPLSPRAVDPLALLMSIDELLQRTVSEEIELRIGSSASLGGSTWRAEVDPGQFELAVINLVINARDAMPDGGELSISIGGVTLDTEDTRGHGEVFSGDYVVVCVKDTGSGMPPEVVERVFEPFFTTKPEGKGSGLGLSMVYGFVKQSGGFVTIASEQGNGTTVRLFLRRAVGVKPARPVPIPGTTTPQGKEHILVVEDDANVRAHMVEQLLDVGFRVSSAPDGREALKLIDAMTDLDLLLTDVVMPGGINGRQLAVEAKRQIPDLRVLYISGYSENALMHQGRLAEGVELLSKPFRRQALLAKVREILNS